jgi:hypothetical protein
MPQQAVPPLAVPAPIGGLADGVPPMAMKPTQALQLINFVVRDGELAVRGGDQRIVAGLPGAVEALHTWRGERTFAGLPDRLVEVGRNVTATIATGLSSGRWTGDVIANDGGSLLVMANGYDGVRAFDGTTWRTATITADTTADGDLDASRLAGATYHMRRMWFWQRGTLDLWYLPAGQFAGVACAVPLAGLARNGGRVVGLAVMQSDTGRSTDDSLVIVTSGGELFVAAGTNPNDAATWSISGPYEIDAPLGWRPLAKVGGEVAVMTKTGLYAVGQIVGTPKERRDETAIGAPVGKAWRREALRPAAPEWQVIEAGADDGVVIVNRPDGRQSVRTSGVWSELAGMPATAWCETADGAWYGTAAGEIRRYGGTIYEQAVDAEVVTSFQRYGRNRLMHAVRIRPAMVSVPVRPRFRLLADYDELPPIPQGHQVTWPATRDALAGPEWDFVWGETGPTERRRWDWNTIAGRGHALAVAMSVRTRAPLRLSGWDLMLTAGGAN